MDGKPMKTVKERMREQRLQRRRRRRKMLCTLFAVVFIAVVILVIVNSPLFAVEKIEIVNKGTSVQQSAIATAAGVCKGDLLWRVDTEKAEQSVYRIPWVSEVSVKRVLPNRIVISVTEGKIAAYISCADGLMAVDEKLKTIVVHDATERQTGFPVFSGVEDAMPTVGMPLVVNEEKMKMIHSFMQEKEYLACVDVIDIANIRQVELTLYTGMKVKLGDCQSLGYKLAAMDEILSQMSADAKGVLDMRMGDGKVSYRRPETEKIPEETPQQGEDLVVEESEESASENNTEGVISPEEEMEVEEIADSGEMTENTAE